MKKKYIYLILKWLLILILSAFAIMTILLILLRWINPPTTAVILVEKFHLDKTINHEWRKIDQIGENVILSILAAEDSNFCNHFGFDFAEIIKAKKQGFVRGASTISQQVSKNLFLWKGRSWFRKGLEAIITVMIESLWPKYRILEVYLNIAETGNGYFGVQAISNAIFKKHSNNLTLKEASYIAVTLPNPKKRNAKKLSNNLKKRAKLVRVGANTLKLESRVSCVI